MVIPLCAPDSGLLWSILRRRLGAFPCDFDCSSAEILSLLKWLPSMASKLKRLLDEIGWSILTALQENARISFSDLGRRVGLSAPAVAVRVRRMEDAGIITGHRPAVAPERLGYSSVAIIPVSPPHGNRARLGPPVRGLPVRPASAQPF